MCVIICSQVLFLTKKDNKYQLNIITISIVSSCFIVISYINGNKFIYFIHQLINSTFLTEITIIITFMNNLIMFRIKRRRRRESVCTSSVCTMYY